jgi:hypothetical protein
MDKITPAHMRSALESGFDRQGRTLSDTQRVRYFAALTAGRAAERREERYRGFLLSRGSAGGDWYITGELGLWPVAYTTLARARGAVDTCLALRAEIAA